MLKALCSGPIPSTRPLRELLLLGTHVPGISTWAPGCVFLLDHHTNEAAHAPLRLALLLCSISE